MGLTTLLGLRRKSAAARRATGAVTPLGWRAHGDSAMNNILPEPGCFHINDGPHYHDVLRELHRILKPDWYLEVGSRGGRSLQFVECGFVAIDPVFRDFPLPAQARGDMHFLARTSDEAFASKMLEKLGVVPDFGFLDGMHLSEFVMRDLINFEGVARPGAVVALHDCLPCSHEMESRDTSVPATGMPWTGDVWKVLLWVLRKRPDLDVAVLDAYKTGLVVISGLDPTSTVLQDSYDDFVAEFSGVRLKDFGTDRFFDSFEIQSSHRYLKTLAAAPRHHRGQIDG